MCTAIAKKGNDLIYGFNLDIDPEVWTFGLYKTKNLFTVGITVGKTTYATHGVNRNGCFGNVPYMNGEPLDPPRGAKRQRIDLMTDRYIRGKLSFEDVLEILETKTLVSIPAATMHSLIGSGDGRFVIAEPGYGVKRVEEDYAVLANFPVLANLTDFSNPFYGKDRFDTAVETLKNSGEDFSVRDALKLLESVKQGGRWGTKVSFVYSKNGNAVNFCLNGDFTKIEVHRFG